MSSKSRAAKYDKISQKEHILKRPDTYIGSVDLTTELMDIYDENENKIISKEISFVPGFFKIYDEILVNARDASQNDDTCDTIKIEYNKEENYIMIYNNGQNGIPIEEHPEHKMLVPSMIFGELLTSSNYDDNEERTTGGRNGYGSKCLYFLQQVPLYNGVIKYAKDITINDKLIGDDGLPRSIKKIITGESQLYKIKQFHGEDYIVNENHILTLHMPDHKKIFWNYHKGGWSVLWFDKDNYKIKSKFFKVFDNKIKCPECDIELSGNLNRHYNRIHKNTPLPKKERKLPEKEPDTDKVLKVKLQVEEFCKNIGDSIFDIELKNYMKLNKTTKSRLAGIKGNIIKWDKKEVKIDPYVLGLWLGDGMQSGYSFALNVDDDPEIYNYLVNWGNDNDCKFKKIGEYAYSISSINNYSKKGYAPFKNLLKYYNLVNNKHIPNDYIVNDINTRYQLLAGIIDTDGYVCRNGQRIIITQCVEHKDIIDGIAFIAGSLGINYFKKLINVSYTYNGEKKFSKAYKLELSGENTSLIPTKLPRKYCKSNRVCSSKSTGKINIEEFNDSNKFVGFTIDGNQRFVLPDFTVTHNCTNILSTQFEVEIGDSQNGKKFKQTWRDNMSVAEKSKVTKYSKKISYVQVKFYPDLKKFKLDTMDDDHYNLFYRRAYDIAGTSNGKLKVFFNDKKIECNGFKKYISFYYPNETVYFEENDRWKVGCIYLPDTNNKVVSFVNGISTYHGGSHANYVIDNIIKSLINNHIKKKNKDIKLSPTLIKENIVFFINSVIINPSFSSQTKDTLTTKVNKFGSKYEPSDTLIKKIAKCGIVDQVIKLALFKENSQLKKSDGRKQIKIKGIIKLEDANKAGSKDSKKCSLILTEGDSAAGCARSGMGVISRDYYGIFPLKGKLLNVREASVKQLMANEEINNIKQIVGLQVDKKYEDNEEFNQLRYGRIIILTDQDVDGSHIKGLLMNFFHHLWPSLLEKKGFITSLSTPIVKAFKGKDTKTFYNLTEYEDFIENNSGYKIKYYKGLGTSTKEESKEYFKDIEDKLIRYITDEETDTSISLAFDKKHSDDRKEWLKKYDRNNILKYEERDVSYNKFINNDLIHFSNDDTSRSIPHIMDGLKPSQRKILYGAFLRKLDKDEVKVAQLAGFVSDRAAYHHGEASLNGAIVGMAQNFIGSNNINILDPAGNFGTRFLGGKDAASPRYIWTKLPKHTTIIFNRDDNNILNNLEEDGMPIEPEYYAPIIPMVLVNGAEGIGTGFSTKIPNYNPIDIINNLIRIMDGEKYKSMKPYYNNFNGSIDKIDKNNFEIKGTYKIKNEKKKDILIIDELPVFQWTQNYKEYIEKLLDVESTKKKRFNNYKENHTDERVLFEIEFNKDTIPDDDDIMKEFKLVRKIGLTNMHLYSNDGCIKKYNSIKEIMMEYYHKRLELYEKRKEYILNILKNQLDTLSYKCKFILMVVEKKLIVNNRKKIDIEGDLIKHKFPKLGDNNDYNYLLGMPIYSLTYEKIEELKKQINIKETEYNNLMNKTGKDLWKDELNELKKYL